MCLLDNFLLAITIGFGLGYSGFFKVHVIKNTYLNRYFNRQLNRYLNTYFLLGENNKKKEKNKKMFQVPCFMFQVKACQVDD